MAAEPYQHVIMRHYRMSVCAGMIVLTALSLIIFVSSVRYSSMRKKLFKFDVL